MTDDQPPVGQDPPPTGPSYQQPEPPEDQAKAVGPAAPEPVKSATPWFKQKRVLIPVAAVAFLGVFGLAVGVGSTPGAAPSTSHTTSATPTKLMTLTLVNSCTNVTSYVEEAVDFGYDDDASSGTASTLVANLRLHITQSPEPIHTDLVLLVANLEEIQTGTTMKVADFTEPAGNILTACGVDYTSPNDPSEELTDETTEEATDEPTEEATDEPTEEPAPKKESKFDKLSDEQQDAYGSAQDYLASSGFSRAGLIDQLSSEYGDDYSKKDAKAAVDALDEDWYEQAVREAKSYRESGHFSTQGLIEQLESDYGAQFTHDQAVYGAEHSR